MSAVSDSVSIKSDTPRTDALIDALASKGDNFDRYCAMAELAMQLERAPLLLREACEAAYKHIADRPHDAEWEWTQELREQLEEALHLQQWEKYK